jgi:hypothetical protein
VTVFLVSSTKIERAEESTMSDDPVRELLRHALATLAYRGGKTVRGAPEGFATFRVAAGSRTPGEILAHVGDLLDWAAWMTRGEHRWQSSEPLSWDREVDRFFAALQTLDAALAAAPLPEGFGPEKVFQGPIADALTHVGQLAMLRRLAGSPVRGENYFRADIAAGRVGREQAPPRQEFG